jgi:negative regulator of sigma E activity
MACTSQAAPPGGNEPFLAAARHGLGAHRQFRGHFRAHERRPISTFRITHLNLNGEEHERIEPARRPAHEIVRKNEEMYCHFRTTKTVRLDTRITRATSRRSCVPPRKRSRRATD